MEVKIIIACLKTKGGGMILGAYPFPLLLIDKKKWFEENKCLVHL